MDQPASSFKLYLLGASRLECDGMPAAIDRRKALALLAYLALTRQTHRRDAIACLLWPDSGQSTARANLRHTLVILKQVLGDDSLAIARESVGIRQDATLWVDTLHFQALLVACRTHGHPPDLVCPDCLPLLTKAVAAPTEQFMAGFSLTDCPAFDDWQRSQQQQLSQALRDALDRLVGYFIEKEDYKAAIEHAQHRLALDTFDEASHRQLMQLYGWSGQQGLALRQFEQCTALLANELGISPSAETVGLMGAIQAGQTTARTDHPHAADSHLQQARVENVWRRAETPWHNLPVRLPVLIGRDHDLQALQEMLQRNDVNLVTLLGPGGVGKTQLSLRIASTLLNHFADGVFIISLAALREPKLVISALAQTWNLQPQNNRPLVESVQRYLRDKQMLLILDNFDHLMEAAPLVSELLANCSYLRIVVTSRELLNVRGEHIFSVAPLSLPKQGQSLSLTKIAEAGAVQLFVQRAQAITPDFVLDESNAVDVVEICTHLDGLPLAIELVVARIRLLPPRILRQRLLGPNASAFELLQGGARDAPARHRTLKSAIAWSYELLTAAEQRLFRLLAVFVGGCTLEAVEHISELSGVAGSDSVLDGLASLVNKSLIQQTEQPDGASRFSLLAMIREFVLEQLQANHDFDEATRAHAETYVAFAELAVPALSGPDHLAWIARLNADLNNCRAALHWVISHQHAELALRLAGVLWSYWLERGYYGEGRQFLVATLQLDGATTRTPARARALTGLGVLSRAQGDMVEARAALEEAVSICREQGDKRGLAVALEKLVEGCFLDLNLPQVYQLYTEAVDLYEHVNDWAGATRIRQQVGFEKYHVGDYDAALAIFEEVLATFRAQQHDAELGLVLLNVGRALFQQQKFAAANQRFFEALSSGEARGDRSLMGHVRYFLGRTAYYQAEYEKAKTFLEESLLINRAIGTRAYGISFPLAFLSAIALHRGNVRGAQTMLSESLSLAYQERHEYAIALLLPFCASLAVILGEHAYAIQLVAAGRSLYDQLGVYLPPNDQAAFDQPLAAARQLLPPAQFAQAWATGTCMTMAEAVGLALREITDKPF